MPTKHCKGYRLIIPLSKMSQPDTVPDFPALSQEQSKAINDSYLRSQAVTDEAITTLAAGLVGTGPETPASLPLFFEYLREGRSELEVLEAVLQYYCQNVTKEVNAAAVFRFFRAVKRPAPEPKSKTKQRKKR